MHGIFEKTYSTKIKIWYFKPNRIYGHWTKSYFYGAKVAKPIFEKMVNMVAYKR